MNKEIITEKELKGKLGDKISKLAKDIGQLEEDGKNNFSKYKYISSNQMVAQLRDKLSENKLAIIPEIIDVNEKEFSSKDKKTIRTIVKMNFELIDTETGYSEVKQWFGADQDTGGKSLPQAITEATKRFYFKLFQVSSKEENDPDEKTTEMNKNDKVEKTTSKEKIENIIIDIMKTDNKETIKECVTELIENGFEEIKTDRGREKILKDKEKVEKMKEIIEENIPF